MSGGNKKPPFTGGLHGGRLFGFGLAGPTAFASVGGAGCGLAVRRDAVWLYNILCA